MALVFACGSEYEDATRWQNIDDNADAGNSGGDNPQPFARSGTMSGNHTSTYDYASLYSYPVPASGTGFVLGAAFRSYDWALANMNLLQVREDVWPNINTHLALSVAANNRMAYLCVTRGGLGFYGSGGTVIATSTYRLLPTTWYYFEIKGVIHDTAGSFEVRVNGNAIPALTVSGVNTKNGGTGNWNRVGTAGSTGVDWDDLYACDLTGSRNNNFLGQVKILAVLPQTDAVAPGTTRTLTPSVGTDHGALVDEVSSGTGLVSDTNYSATVGAKDTYNFPAMAPFPYGGTGNVFAMITSLFVYRTDLHTRKVCHVVRTGGTDYDGPNVEPSNQRRASLKIWDLNPATGLPWTIAEVDAIEAGMKVTE